jgi:UDP-N-acetylglucosamine 1-carboxyvinyltransferase
VIVEREAGGIRVVGKPPFKPVDVTTEPHPGFPTDMQAQMMLLCASARDRASSPRRSSRTASCTCPSCTAWAPASTSAAARLSSTGLAGKKGAKLQGASVMATDLRASASLVLAGLVAEGETEVRRVYHIDRGYERIEAKLAALGADVEARQGQ